ncbi:MAG: DUF4405 domain-containing protein [Gordonibacter sp.]|uniref:DUF4405 domain-containing protein n=1 Tax=Gordonibacter sp. TaxID=1968902 RepID=UPI002FCCA63A
MDKKKFLIDVVALLVFGVVMNPAITGIGVHEWIGLVLLIVFFIHVLMSIDWMVDTVKNLRVGTSWTRRGNFALDMLIVITCMVVTVSGLLVSGAVLPTFGLYADGYYFWNPLHAMSAKVLLALLLVHVFVHWKWFASVLRKGRGDSSDGSSSTERRDR